MSEANQVADGANPAQASEASVDDRLGALIGAELGVEEEKQQPEAEEGQEEEGTDEAEPTDGEEEPLDEAADGQEGEEGEQAEPELETVQIGDETYEVPPAVAKAVMRHSEFMRRVTTVEAREQQVAQLEQVATLKAQTLSQLEPLIADIRNVSLAIEKGERETDWNWLRANDPIEYNTKQIDLANAKQVLADLKARRTTAEAQISQAEQSHRAAITAEGHKALTTKIKGWGPELAGKLSSYAVSLGFNAGDVAGVINPLNVVLLHKAYQYDQSRKANSKVNLDGKRIAPTVPVMRPGSTPNKANVATMKRYSEDRARLKRTGSLEDAARLIQIS